MQRLTSVPLQGHVILLPAGVDHASAWQALTALLAASAPPGFSGLLATPTRQGDEIVFSCPPGPLARYNDLDQDGRMRLRAAIGSLVSTMRRAAEEAARRDPAGSGHLPALAASAIEIPSFELVYAHEGRPVLAGWGMAPVGAPGGLGLVRVLDDGRAADPAAAVGWPGLGLAALTLVLLAGAALAAAPWVARWTAPSAPSCQVIPGELDAMRDLLREQDREQQLRVQLASLQEDLGRRRAQCALPPAPPPRAAVAPPPEPPPPQVAQNVPPPDPPPAPQPPAQPPPAQPKAPEPPPRPPPNTQPCNAETKSGGRGVTETRHFLGPKPGHVTVVGDMFRFPDRLRVYHQGRLVAETPGFVSGPGTIGFDWSPPPNSRPEDQVVTVEVTGDPAGRDTRWKYTLGCPVGRGP